MVVPTPRLWLAGALFSVIPCLSAAGEAPAELSPVVSVATRTPVAANKLNVPVLVITRADIERSQALDVAELLRFHAGVELGRNGGAGQNTGLFLRGTESNHTLVLVDGVEINPGTLGGAAIYNLRPDMIERIELVKGPRSALWGSEAIGGVVNIVTRSAGEGSDWSASAGGGRYDTRMSALEARLRGHGIGLSFNFSNLDTGGFPTLRGSDIDRAHDNTTFNLRTDATLGEARFGLRYWEARGNTEYLDFFLAPVEQDYLNSVLAADLALQPRDNWTSVLTLSKSRDEIQQLGQNDYVVTDRRVADWQNTLQLGENRLLTAGVQVADENTDSLSFGSGFEDSTRVTEFYLSHQLDLGDHNLLLAARNTDHETFGSVMTWNLEYGLELAPATRLTAGLGTAYRAPDGTDRFGFGGNPDLRPERARNIEAGLRRDFSRSHLTINVFRNNIDDLVEYVFDPVTFDGGNINVGRASIRGIDASFQFSSENWQWRLGAVIQNPENRVDGSELPRRARRSLTASLVRRFDWSEFGLDLLATESRRDTSFGDTRNAGYVLANLTSRIRLSQRLSLRARVENLLNSDYQTAAGYNSPGRSLYATLEYRQR